MISPLLLFAAASQGQPAPVSRWVLQADPSLCALERQSPSQRATLSIATLPGSDAYRVVIVTGTATPGRSYEPAYMSFGTADRVLGRGAASAAADGSSMLTMEGLPADVLDRLAGASVAKFGFVDGAEAAIDVSGSAKAVDAMRRCEASQLTEWGADPSQFAPGGQRMTALKRRDDWLSNATIMRIAALTRQADVDAAYRVSIADTGRVDGCVPLSAVVETKITKAVCGEVLKQQLFKPGMGPDGVATRGIATFRVVVSKQPT